MGSVNRTQTLIGGRTFTLHMVHDITDHAIPFRGIFWIVTGVPVGITSSFEVIAFHAVAKSRRAEEIFEQHARFLAERDPLTRTLNRFGFSNKVNRMIQDCDLACRRACLVQIDANKFKEINDQYGPPWAILPSVQLPN
ncbi:GGDEF domain-containing protein [Boseongicola aestuarii]|uniref:Putative diguanylate cyclase n=1 Tax=Boseongicola aestuarii TaxID=1470561 RepID=A0A238J313_9RHOB|nr:putative diguanylate cyclase [Boseongicola aestuarii]